jgi:signal transduction histidine kinase
MLKSLSDRRTLLATSLAVWVILLTFAGSYAWLQRRVAALVEADTHRILDRELELTDRIDRTAGRETLLRALRIRTGYADRTYFWMMVDEKDRPLIVDTKQIPIGFERLVTLPNHARIPLADKQDAYVCFIRLADGARVIIGRIDVRRSILARDFAYASTVAVLVLLFAAILTLVVFDRYVVSHLRSLSETAKRIMRGQMAARAPQPQRFEALGSMTRTFNEMLDQNEALVGGLRTVTESLAHDLRRPLMRVRRGIEAARVAGDEATRDAALALAETNATRALQTFNALVDLARAEAGLSRESMEQVDVTAVVADVIDLFEPLAEERSQPIERQLASCTAVAHRQLLSQAVSNLLDNAIKFSPPGQPLKVTVESRGPGAGCDVVVEDRGPGVPEHARAQVLQPFVRLEGGDETGAGMGLAIAAAVARLHGGNLFLESAEPGLRARLRLGVMPAATTN